MKVVKQKITDLYLAYGSNLNMKQMKWRCPGATAQGSVFLAGHRLVFRGVADVIEAPGFEVPVGVWKITEKCEEALDRYEGWPRLYRKKLVRIKFQGKRVLAMMYVMNRDGFGEPSDHYYDTIAEGYDDFVLPAGYLHEAARSAEKLERDRRVREATKRLKKVKPKAKEYKGHENHPAPKVKKFITAEGRQTVARELPFPGQDDLYEGRPKPPPTSNWPYATPSRASSYQSPNLIQEDEDDDED